MVSIAKNVIPKYEGWIKEITESHIEFLKLRSITKNSFMNKSFEELSEVRESKVFDLIKILWSGKAFGSLGRGGVREEAIEENLEVFYYATANLLNSQRKDVSPSEMLSAIKLQVDDRGELRAIKLRALSIVSDLRIPSLFSRRLFLKTAKFLNISLDFPDDLETLGHILQSYLLNQQRDKYTKYVFPWIVYEWYNEYYKALDLINKMPELKRGSERKGFVKAAQKMLNRTGSRLTIDGLFGMNLENEVLILQKDYDLHPNGILNKVTSRKLLDLAAHQGEDLSEIVIILGQEVGLEGDEMKSSDDGKITLDSGLATVHKEGDHSHEDQLEFKNDYTALSSLIAYNKVEPPLAIGLFGHWGSGKSFFMEKMYDTINDLSKKNSKVYCENIVQVKFNSWHYSDANLWASLVTEIFETINQYFEGTDQIYEKLASSREQLKYANNEKKDLETKKGELTGRLTAIQTKKRKSEKSLGDIKDRKIIEWVKSDPWISRKKKEIESNLKQDQDIDLDTIQTQIQELNGFWNKLKRSFKLIKKYKTGNWISLILVAVVVFFLMNYTFPNWFADLDAAINWILKSTASLVTIGLPTVLNVFRKVEKGLNRLKEVDAGWEEVREKARNRKTSEEIVLEKELDRSNMQEDNLTQRQSEIQEKINQLDSELSDIRSGKNLAKFIREKSQDQRYKSELGIISWIRKDFEELDNLLIKQKIAIKRKEGNTNKKKEENKSIDRIVLYIDDLDRCEETRVVEVLQAVHLLLAFPLFAVVVGVDPRWVSRALEKQYPELLENRNNKSSRSEDKVSEKDENEKGDSLFNEGASATAFDYLEKIFQIPFSLKIVQEKTAKDLIESLAKPGKSIHGEALVVVVDETVGIDESVGVSKSTKKTDKDKETSESQSQAASTPPVVKEPDPKALEISKEEGDFMKEIASNIGYTPRTINRYINIYKIIRSHGGVIHSDNQLEDYKAIMIMLSIVMGMNFEPDKLFEEMKKSKAKTIETFLKASKILFPKKKLLLKNIPAEDLKIALGNFISNVDLVSRFSYRL